jgi:hypothetical protein
MDLDLVELILRMEEIFSIGLPDDECVEEKRRCVAPHPHLTLARQCELLGLPRSTFYHQPAGESNENLQQSDLHQIAHRKPIFGIDLDRE